MRKSLVFVYLLLCIFGMTAIQAQPPTVIRGRLEKTTAPLKKYPSTSIGLSVIVEDEMVNEENIENVFKNNGKIQTDPVLQRNSPARLSSYLLPAQSTIINSWEGAAIPNTSPPDPTLGVGPNHVVQLVNSFNGALLNIFNKTGTPIISNLTLSNIHGVPGAAGDPIVQYDKLADRWLLSEFSKLAPYKLIVLLSTTNDPTGTYYVYTYNFGADFPDYPKYAVWPNAYYCTTNNFPNLGAYKNSSIIAFDRAKMLVGDPTASIIKFDLGAITNPTYFTASPATYQGGLVPSTSAPGMFAYLAPDEFAATTNTVDSVGIVFLNPNFANPSASSYGTQSFVAAPYNAEVGGNIPQPGTSNKLNPVDRRVMNQPVYRDFGTHQSIFFCHTVGLINKTAAIRWYELRNTGSGYTLYQQGTYSPDDTHRFMPSIAVNQFGEMILAYMASSDVNNVYPSLRFAARRATDPLGNLNSYEETTIVDGTGPHLANTRAGDYSHLQVDPVDDSSFWFTGQYHKTPDLFGGYTRIAQLDLALPLSWDTKLLNIHTPVNNNSFCNTNITPQISFKNVGTNTVTSLTIVSIVDNGIPVTNNWTGFLNIGDIDTVDLAAFTTNVGAHTLKIYTTQPNGNADQKPINDTIAISFNVITPLPTPITEGFEIPIFPPVGWRVINPNFATKQWERITDAAASGTTSVRMNFFDYATGVNDLDYLISPTLESSNFDSILVSFSRAYRKYDASTINANDTLSIQISTDCGVTFPITAWKKGGADLASNNYFLDTNYIPLPQDWLAETVNLKPYLPNNANNCTIAFVGKNGYGQNLYLDDINIKLTKRTATDASIKKILQPNATSCETTFAPVLEWENNGTDSLQSVNINYTLNGAAVQTHTLTKLMLATGQSLKDTFSIVTLPPGNYQLKAYTTEPNSLPDLMPRNDTATLNFSIFLPVNGSVKEGFESNNFPPKNWAVLASNNLFSWSRNTLGASTGVASTWMRNKVFNGNGAIEDLYSPLIQINHPDSVLVRFDVAYFAPPYTGGIPVKQDTLEVLLTTDCGKTFTSFYKQGGENLKTTSANFAPIYPPTDSVAFVPANKNEWRTDAINISSLVSANTTSLQIVFRNINGYGNNIFLDNININPITVAAKLKREGYMIVPNPTNGLFSVQHYLPPVKLKSIQIFSISGMLLWQEIFNGNANTNIPINITSYPAGVYIVRLQYTDKVISQRLVKAR
jgi:hypothetical protein